MPVLYNVQTKKPEQLDGEELQMALAQGTHSYAASDSVTVKNPDGEMGTIPAVNVQKALAQGYRVQTPTEKAVQDYVDQNQGLKGAVKVGLGQLVDEAALGLPELIFDKTADPFEVAKKDALKKEHDFANTVGGITGFGASLFTGGPLFNLATKGGEKAAGLIAEKIIASSAGEIGKRSAMEAARGVLGNLAAKGVGGAVEGAILSAPHMITEAALGDPDQAAEALLSGVSIGALFGTGGVAARELFNLGKKGVRSVAELGQEAISKGSDTAAVAARKLAKVITGVDEEQILRYANNHERINQVGTNYSLEGLKDEIDNGINSVRDKLEIAKQNEERMRLQLDQAYGIEKQRLSQVRAPQSLAPEVMGELENLKSRLGEKSDELFSVLQGSDVSMQTRDLKKYVDKQIEALRPTKGAAVFGEAAKAEEARLQRLKSDLDTLPDQVQADVVKKIIKQMDPDLNFSQGAGEFNELSQRNAKSFRKFMNDNLRKSPEAAQILDEMARVSDVLGRASKKFGTLERATSSLNGINTVKGKLNKDLLDELSSVSGKNFSGELAEFERAKMLLDKSKVQDIRGEILPGLTSEYEGAKKALDDVVSMNEPMKRLSQERTQAMIRNQGFKNASIEDRRALEYLGELNGKNYAELIDDLNTFNAFKSSPNGSRRALMFGTAGAAIGGAMGGAPGAMLGSTLGSATGGTMDYFGGQILKKIIDGTPDVSGLLFAEKQMKKVAEKLDTIPEALSGLAKKSPVAGRTGSLEALMRILDGDEKKGSNSQAERAKRLQEFSNKASVWASNPEQSTAKLAGLLSPLTQGGAPMISAALGAKYNQAVQYVFQAVPKPPRPNSPFAPQYVWKPSDQQLSAFEQKLQTVMDPFSVFDELGKGTLTKNHIDALKAVYPKLYFQMRSRVQKEMTTGVKPIPYNNRVKLSLLMDAPMDSSMTPQAILDFQKTFIKNEQPQPKGSNLKLSMANDMASDVDKLMG